MLGKQYNLASDNLPVKDVKSIEVYENHQPIKLLEDKLPTDEAAFNIKLKRKITKTLTGNAKVGVSPFLWDTKVTPMFFSKQVQALLVAQSNNVGENVSKYTNAISVEDMASFQQFGTTRFQTIGSIQGNALSNKRWRNNNSYLITPNLLFPLGNHFNLRVNHSSTIDNTDYQTNENSQFYLNNERIERNQQTNELKDIQKHKTNLLLEKNKKNLYVKNAFTAKFVTEDLQQRLQLPTNAFTQGATEQLNDFENKIKILLPLKNEDIIELKSELQYQTTRNDLELPTNSSALLQQLFVGEQLQQTVTDKLFQTNHAVGKKFLVKTVEVELDAGINTTATNLVTAINTPMQTGVVTTNTMKATVQSGYINPSFKWRKNKLTIRVAPNLSYTQTRIKNIENNEQNQQQATPFEPSVSVLIEPNGKWSIYNYGRIGQQFSTFGKNNIGYFVNNAQNVSYGGQLIVDDLRTKTFGTRAKYKNIFSSLFVNGSYFISERNQNLLNKITYNNDGSRALETIQSPNTSLTQNATFEIGKLFSELNLNAKLKLRYGAQNGVVLLDQQPENVQNNALTAQLTINEKFTDEFVFNLVATSNFYQNKLFGLTTTNQQYGLKSQFTYLPSLTQSVGISNELLYNQQQNVTASFLDLYWRKKLNNKYKLLIEANNILNQDEYVSYNATLNEEYIRTQNLRPHQFLVGVQFRIGKK